VRCAVGSWGGRRPSLGGYVTVTGPNDGGHRLRRAFMLPIPRILLYPPGLLLAPESRSRSKSSAWRVRHVVLQLFHH
jgi:hypothetical protein